MLHDLKIKPEYFNAVLEGKKTFEIRNNDRNFQVDDSITLKEFDEGQYTGRSIGTFEITYVLKGPCYGLQEGYCIFSFK